MESKKFTVTAVGKNRLDVLNRISTLYIQKQIPVESLSYQNTSAESGKYQIVCFSTREDAIKRIVDQISNYVDISQAYYTK